MAPSDPAFRRSVLWVALACVAAGLLATYAPAFGQDMDTAHQLSEYLAAGEFAPARDVVAKMAAGEERDQWLSRIAARQIEAGARSASLATAASIQDDRLRAASLKDLGSHMLGGTARGGAAIADFDTLINLIESTIAPDTWDSVGGAGAIQPFPTGVYVDAAGELKRRVWDREVGELEALRRESLHQSTPRPVASTSALRKISLTRLEKQIQLRRAAGLPPDESMRLLAGLYELKYVFVYPDTGDIVLAGPAGGWEATGDDRMVNIETRRPVLQLDDFIVALRNAYSSSPRFGCAITPLPENLAATQSFLAESRQRSLPAGKRDAWVAALREKLGQQRVDVFGIDPRTRAARVLVEADYHMKLIGMGLEDGTLGVTSYLDLLKAQGKVPPAMSVLRWWFTVNYEAVEATPHHDAFQMRGQGVRVLSENEMLTATGQRVHTGTSDELNREFADSFTRNFVALAEKYPVYAELRNVFDLALVAALLRAEDLPEQVGWHLTDFGPQGSYQVALGAAPRSVQSVINLRDISRTQFVVGVSGGVSVDLGRLVKRDAIQPDNYGLLPAVWNGSKPRAKIDDSAWWWD